VKTQKEKLAEGYLPVFRWIEIASTLTFISVSLLLVWKLRGWASLHAGFAVTAFFVGWVSADFVSGFVHWAADTWGTTEWPFIGQTLIRTFREHHADPEAITRHDFIETNGTNCLISLPILFWCFWASPNFGVVWMFSMVTWVFATNQIHKWSHQRARPEWVTALQRMGIILSPEHHSNHHEAPFMRYYCITAGWLNQPLLAIGFFGMMEKLITAMTGALPREHDLQVVDAVLSESRHG
jgi:ubiquitin-conjugating enzyme E2 variant